MTSGDLLGEAVAELYSADPEGFIPRRDELAGQARQAGQAPVAKQIAALRKPTRSAWVINQFARADPDAVARLTELGDELRGVERSGDGRKLRELSQARRQLLATLVRQALAASGQSVPPAAMREEITATFAAALADPEVAGQIEQGMLVRAAYRSGFGSAPALSVVPPLPDSHRVAKAKAKANPRLAPAPLTPATRQTATDETTTPSKTATSSKTATTSKATAPRTKTKEATARAEQAAAEARAAHEQRRAKVQAKAEQALAQADEALKAAIQHEKDQEKAVRRLERELGQTRSRLRSAAADVRRAEAIQRNARQALDRLPD